MSKAFVCEICKETFTKGKSLNAEVGEHDVSTIIMIRDNQDSLREKEISIDMKIWSGTERGFPTHTGRGNNSKPDIDLCPKCLIMVLKDIFENKSCKEVEWNF